jgi:ubiquinone/menaquinone biosynthesis C-methylase UbiE
MKRVVARELLDEPIESFTELEGNMADIEFANRVFGGISPVVREIRRTDARSLLDVCCGSADIPLAAARDAQRRGSPLALTVLDCSAHMLMIARARAQRVGEVSFVAGDARALPFGDRSFDVVTCNLALHHFEPDAARLLLRELRRVARLMPLVCDLRRSLPAYAAALAWSRTTSNRLTRHDAPLSVRRAYTPREAQALAYDAGWRAPRVRSEAFFRMTISDRGRA